MLLKLLSTLIEIRHLICGNNYSWILNFNLTYKTLQAGAGSGLLISMLEKFNLFHWANLITVAIVVKMHKSALEEKSSFTMLSLLH